MAEYSKKLHYIRNGVTYDITLYDDPSDIDNPPKITIKDGSKTIYAGTIEDLSDDNISHLRTKYNNKTLAIAKEINNKFDLKNYAKNNIANYTTITSLPQSEINKLTNIKIAPDASSAFSNCQKLTSMPQSLTKTWDTSKVTDMSLMFYYCRALTVAPYLKCAKVCKQMFSSCVSLIDVSALDMSETTNAYFMFSGSALTNTAASVLNWDNVTNADYAFSECRKFTDIPALNYSKLNNAEGIFQSCDGIKTINIPSSVNFHPGVLMSAFRDCINLKEVKVLDCSKSSDVRSLFSGCNNLTSVAKLDTSMGLYFSYMFSECESLPSTFPWAIDISSLSYYADRGWCTSNNIDMYIANMFENSSVTKVQFKNAGSNIRSMLTSQLLKGNNTLTIQFV